MDWSMLQMDLALGFLIASASAAARRIPRCPNTSSASCPI